MLVLWWFGTTVVAVILMGWVVGHWLLSPTWQMIVKSRK